MMHQHEPPIKHSPAGTLQDGTEVGRFQLRNGPLEVTILEYGAIIESIVYLHEDGHRQSLCRALNGLADYERDAAYTGAAVGPVANRMRDAQYRIGAEVVYVAANEGQHQLHGGPNGLHQSLWSAEAVVDARGPSVELTCMHPDGTDGYRGNLLVRLRYTLGGMGDLIAEFTALSDQPRPVSLTIHPYFGFEGERHTHGLCLLTDQYQEVDEHGLPTGKVASVVGTKLDFTQYRQVHAAAVDHTYIFAASHCVVPRAKLVSSSMTLTVSSDQPALQVYVCQEPNAADTWVCLEPHGFVDATRFPDLPTVMVMPNEVYRHATVFEWTLIDPS